MARAKSLKFKGQYIERKDDDGNVIISGFAESFPGVPTRDLDENDVKELTDDQYRDATESGLYVAPAPAAAKKRAAAKPRNASAAKPANKAVAPEANRGASEEAAGDRNASDDRPA